uniref:Transposase Tc5 C-terminal domain-containing protein n=1 Tax=Acrobeloides nanus TaxID=290746 RepID=A0A914DYA7_9BILA
MESIQPVVSASGRLMSPLCVVFYIPYKEPAIFQREMSQFPNLKAYSTTSGLFNAEKEMDYFKNTLLRDIDNDSLMLVDSWNGFQQTIDNPNISRNIKFEVMPKKTTSKIQPLDVFFNRQWKVFMRSLSDKIRRLHMNFTLSERENIARIISVVHYMFTADRFVPLIIYAWWASGYLIDRPPRNFDTPAQYCLGFQPILKCHKANCNTIGFLRCSHCENVYCFEHTMIDLHVH